MLRNCEEQRIDVVVGALFTISRTDEFIFTEPYNTDTVSVFARDDSSVDTLRDLGNRVAAVTEGDGMELTEGAGIENLRVTGPLVLIPGTVILLAGWVWTLKRQVARQTADELTGLANRRLFDTIAEKEFPRARRRAEVFSVLFLNLDHFNSVNDTLARYGGEEFVALLRDADRCYRLRGAAKLVGRKDDERVLRVITIEGQNCCRAVSICAFQDINLAAVADDHMCCSERSLFRRGI